MSGRRGKFEGIEKERVEGKNGRIWRWAGLGGDPQSVSAKQCLEIKGVEVVRCTTAMSGKRE